MKQEIVKLDGFTITLKELRIKDVVKAVANIQEVFGDKDLDIQKLVTDKFPIIVDIASGFITMPDEMTVDDLTFSDIDAITPAFKEVNKSFLEKLDALGLGFNLVPEPIAERVLKED